MPIPSTVADLSATAALNSPSGSESPTQGDDFIRAHAAIIRQVSDAQATADALLRSDVASTGSSGLGDALVGVKNTATGGVARTQHALNQEKVVTIEDFGGVPGAGNNTTAFQDAVAALPNGGTVRFATVGEWRLNGVVTGTNITIEMAGGKGEYDLNCIRPFSSASPALTIGDNTTLTRYCSLKNCHISGTDGTVGAQTTATGNAPQALLIKGGVYDFHADRSVIYNGIQTVALVPVLSGESISGVTFFRCHFRNDLSAVTTARLIYAARYENSGTSPDLGYLTALSFVSTRANGPKNPAATPGSGGYLLELAVLGNVGITCAVTDSYWDCRDNAGVLFTGAGSGLVCQNFQLDAGGTGKVILQGESTTLNIARYVVGNLRHGGQKFRNSAGTTIDLPSEADTFAYRPLLQQTYVIGPQRWTAATDPYDNANTAPYQDTASATGPLLTYQSTGDGLETANGARTTRGMISELITLNTGGTTTNSAANLLPDNSVIEAVVCRVTTTIATATSWAVGDPTTSARFSAANSTLVAGTTSIGLTHVDQTGAAGPKQVTGNNLRITTVGTPSAGAIRVTVFYRQFRAPTS